MLKRAGEKSCGKLLTTTVQALWGDFERHFEDGLTKDVELNRKWQKDSMDL